jgi:(2S)-methylsuccinyl-CoA dehydrogenase
MSRSPDILLADVTGLCTEALGHAETFLSAAREAVNKRAGAKGETAEQEQVAVHGFAWMATYVEALRQMLGWAKRLEAERALGELESLLLQCLYGEYLAQLYGGLAMSQSEIVRPRDLGISPKTVHGYFDGAVKTLVHGGSGAAVRTRIATLIEDGNFGATGLGDETLEMVRDQFRRFAEAEITPKAQGWHIRDELIPLDVIGQMAALGVFGLTVPEESGGLGLGKLAMCVVTEELSRASLGVGSLGTRSEIAAELIRLNGTEEQKRHWLPRIASGDILPTAVFTEPDVGSDLANLKTRATKEGDAYRVTGAKTWTTHGARSDLMTLLVRTGTAPGYKGLSMLLAEKPRGTPAEPFPAAGMSGTEIAVLGYRGMKEYEIAFDRFTVSAGGLLGGAEGDGFKQLMATFESARIQTAARATGVAQNALELGLAYARQRSQFGKPIYAYPRIHGKLAWMAVETMAARQLAYFAAREKDSGRRCDIEAGMAKLLGARVAWSNADSALQIHGGNGYAVEYPISRVLCDARILSIFEGAAEIQAQVIARGLLGTGRN